VCVVCVCGVWCVCGVGSCLVSVSLYNGSGGGALLGKWVFISDQQNSCFYMESVHPRDKLSNQNPLTSLAKHISAFWFTKVSIH